MVLLPPPGPAEAAVDASDAAATAALGEGEAVASIALHESIQRKLAHAEGVLIPTLSRDPAGKPSTPDADATEEPAVAR